jgi:hypothetical protein
MTSATLSHRAAASDGVVPWDAKPLDLDICWSVDHLGTCVIEFLHGVCCFYQGYFTLRRSPRGVYARIPDQTTILDSNRMNPSTRVCVVRSAWAPAVVSYLARQ